MKFIFSNIVITHKGDNAYHQIRKSHPKEYFVGHQLPLSPQCHNIQQISKNTCNTMFKDKRLYFLFF